ncbi:predicted protein [Sclerotinia sclerotiorum 1980 UF-70]|uniref:Uncharacterized protein n=1 Tax=Sclerotinia sclerotiorum (strain ATCC 18683 / 1980 / Ss-1) TaxID=665079 RepID=A7EQ85_SCLS1|nr:predicted protein [Sclerotinia sclerotiorum 1980 UF-70]EDO05001.1 predicted protein [Sclerotinia sclerotiorum 1980 UF-70]
MISLVPSPESSFIVLKGLRRWRSLALKDLKDFYFLFNQFPMDWHRKCILPFPIYAVVMCGHFMILFTYSDFAQNL